VEGLLLTAVSAAGHDGRHSWLLLPLHAWHLIELLELRLPSVIRLVLRSEAPTLAVLRQVDVIAAGLSWVRRVRLLLLLLLLAMVSRRPSPAFRLPRVTSTL
jgi:hypothetical protein